MSRSDADVESAGDFEPVPEVDKRLWNAIHARHFCIILRQDVLLVCRHLTSRSPAAGMRGWPQVCNALMVRANEHATFRILAQPAYSAAHHTANKADHVIDTRSIYFCLKRIDVRLLRGVHACPRVSSFQAGPYRGHGGSGSHTCIQ